MNYSSDKKGAERVAQAIIDSAGEPSVFDKRVVSQSWSDAYASNGSPHFGQRESGTGLSPIT
jgi:hypothetical protein